jgi:D-3-phosphoglycerate dehydrogenase / 2-oxoglutarate reductase
VRILIAEPEDFSRGALQLLNGVGEVELRRPAADELPRVFLEYDVVFLRLGFRITRDALGQRPRTRVLALNVTGLDHVDLEACRERGIDVVSLRGETEFLRTIRATAELTVGLLLALMRQIAPAARSVRQGLFDRDPFRGHELFEKTAGVVGVGRIGSLVAGYYRAFGMNVIGYDPAPELWPAGVERVGSMALLCERSDVVSVHASYGPDTHHLIGRAELAEMKESAVLVNTARGGLIDEVALLRAIDSGKLAGAALDVVQGEPQPGSDHPLLAYARTSDRLLIVPHIGGNTFESLDRTERFVAARVIERLERGRSQ